MKNLSQNQKVNMMDFLDAGDGKNISKIPARPVFKKNFLLFVVYLNLAQGESRLFGR
jgi:hypothetical protein